jgi:hypothetical protein
MLEVFAVSTAGCMITVVAFISIWVATGCGRSVRRFPRRGVLRGRG